MLSKAAISVLESFREREKQETPICKHSVSEETGNSKVQTLIFGAKISNIFQGWATAPPPAPLLVKLRLLSFIPTKVGIKTVGIKTEMILKEKVPIGYTY